MEEEPEARDIVLMPGVKISGLSRLSANQHGSVAQLDEPVATNHGEMQVRILSGLFDNLDRVSRHGFCMFMLRKLGTRSTLVGEIQNRRMQSNF